MSLLLSTLKASFETITIDGNGVPQSYAGIVNISSALYAGALTAIGGASQVQGTFNSINGITVAEGTGAWQNASTNIAVNGLNGADATAASGGSNGASAALTEGTHLSTGNLVAGAGGNATAHSGGTGGDAQVTLLPTGTSWSFNCTVGADAVDSVASGGNCIINLASTQTSATFSLGITCPVTTNGTRAAAAFQLNVTGGSLTDIYASFSWSWANTSGPHGPSIDISGTAASDTGATTSLQNVAYACLSGGPPIGTLNMGGTCGPAGAQTLIYIGYLYGEGWAVTNN